MFGSHDKQAANADRAWEQLMTTGLDCFVEPFGSLSGLEGDDLIDCFAYASCQFLVATLGPRRIDDSPFITKHSDLTAEDISALYPNILDAMAALHNIRSRRHGDIVRAAFTYIGFGVMPIFDESMRGPRISAVEVSRSLFPVMRSILGEQIKDGAQFDIVGALKLQFVLQVIDEGIIREGTKNLG